MTFFFPVLICLLALLLWGRNARSAGSQRRIVQLVVATGWMLVRSLAQWRRKLGRRGSVALLLVALFFGCATTQHAGEPGLPEKEGIASYYAGEYAGRSTANGELFDPEALTAAHRSLPFGTRVRVTRLDEADEPSVVVRINDRGPFKDGRIIDLSKAAARKLGMIREGIVEVRLDVVSYPDGTEVSSSSSSGRSW